MRVHVQVKVYVQAGASLRYARPRHADALILAKRLPFILNCYGGFRRRSDFQGCNISAIVGVMKTSRLLLLAGLMLVAGKMAFGLTVPVMQDTDTNSGEVLVSTANGTAVTLTVDAKQFALIRFDLSNPAVVPPSFTGTNINSAILQLCVTSVTSTSDVLIHVVTSDWSETFRGKPTRIPSIDPAVIAIIPGAEIAKHNFVTADVTQAVANALASGTSYGFAIEAASQQVIKGGGQFRATFASKEGPADGAAPVLYIDAKAASLAGIPRGPPGRPGQRVRRARQAPLERLGRLGRQGTPDPREFREWRERPERRAQPELRGRQGPRDRGSPELRERPARPGPRAAARRILSPWARLPGAPRPG